MRIHCLYNKPEKNTHENEWGEANLCMHTRSYAGRYTTALLMSETTHESTNNRTNGKKKKEM